MTRPGFFLIPKHNPLLASQLVGAMQPSLVKTFSGVISRQQRDTWHELSPYSILLTADHPISSEPLEEDAIAQQAQRHVDAWSRQRDEGKGDLWMTLNEPHIEQGQDYRRRLAAYHVTALALAHGRGLNLCVLNFSVGWPRVRDLDGVDWWADFAPVAQAMRPGDYLGLHEYWPKQGPLYRYPYLAGRHRFCPFDVPILISECGLDQGTVDAVGNKGWKNYLTPQQYLAELLQYHATLSDPRVRGTAIFLHDYESNNWDDFDLQPLTQQCLWKPEQWTNLQDPVAPPTRLLSPIDGNPIVTQRFGENPDYYRQFGVAGHTGIDYGVPMGTAVHAAAAGTVVGIADLGSSSFGLHVVLNHRWGQTLYAHLSGLKVQLQEEVEAGQTIAQSGNSGNSTGPHLHFQLKVFGREAPGYAGCCDPAPYLAPCPALDSPAQEPAAQEPAASQPAASQPAAQQPTTSPGLQAIADARWHAEEATRELEGALQQIEAALEASQAALAAGQAARRRLLDLVIPPLYGIEGR